MFQGGGQFDTWGTIEALRKRVLEFAYENLKGKSVTNKHDHRKIQISKVGLKKTIRHKTKGGEPQDHPLSVLVLDKLLETAMHVDSVQDRNDRRNIKAVHTYKNQLSVDGRLYDVELIVREHEDGSRFYSHLLMRKEQSAIGERNSESHQASVAPSKHRAEIIDGADAKSQENEKVAGSSAQSKGYSPTANSELANHNAPSIAQQDNTAKIEALTAEYKRMRDIARYLQSGEINLRKALEEANNGVKPKRFKRKAHISNEATRLANEIKEAKLFSTLQTKKTDKGVALFSKTSIVPNNPNKKGMPVAEVERIVDEFKQRFPGAAKLDFTVSRTQEEALGGIEVRERVSGFYLPKSKQVRLVASNIHNIREARRTLQHEVLAHHGLNLFEPSIKREILEVVTASRNNPFIKTVFNTIERNGYDSNNKTLIAEEVIATIAEDTNLSPSLQKAWDVVLSAMMEIIRKAGFLQGVVSKSELRSLVRSMAEGLRRNMSQRTFPESDGAQFQLSKSDAVMQGQPLFSRTSVKPWPADFPKLFAHTTVSKVTNHPDFDAAKAGNNDAAMRLVADLAKDDRLKDLASKYPDAIVVSVMEEEPSGRNKIPSALASALSKHGLHVDESIRSTGTLSRKKLSAAERLIARKEFGGKVIEGAEYIIADDVATQGGTFHELRHHIENNGGHVVAATSLAFSAGSNIVAIQPATIDALVAKFGRDHLEELLYRENIAGNIESLTESEGRAALRFASIDRLRARINDARFSSLASRDDEGSGTLNSLRSTVFGQSNNPEKAAHRGGLSISDAERTLRKDKRLSKLIAKGLLKVVASEFGVPMGASQYSISQGEFAADVDALMNGSMKRGDILHLGRTPEVLQMLGAKRLPVTMSQKVAEKVLLLESFA